MAFNFLSAPMRAMGRGFGSAASSGARPFGMNQSTQPQVQPTRLGGNRFGGFGQRQLPANDLPSQGGYGGNYGRQGIGPSQSPVQSKWQRFAGQFGGQMPMSGGLYNMPQPSQPQDSTGLGSMPFGRGMFRNPGQSQQPQMRPVEPYPMEQPIGQDMGIGQAGGIGPSFDLSQMTGGNSGIAGGLFNRGFGDYRLQ